MSIGRCLPLVALTLLVAAACGGQGAEREPSAQQGRRMAQLTAANCPAGYRVIIGTAGNDALNGTSGSDCILGFGGDDTISGGGGSDFLVGGDGQDILYGGNGADSLYGEEGNDTLLGEAGVDTLDGGNGDDLLRGGASADVLYGGAGRDRLHGEDNDDTLRGGADDDIIHGDGGNDLAFGDEGDDVIDGDLNSDELHGGLGDDAMYGDAANDTLFGDDGDDALLGGAGSNPTDGGPGTDACSGTSCERPALTLSGCTLDSQCANGARCIADFGLCLGCVADQDADRVCDSKDGCPNDAAKSSAGICGCGVSDADSDGDGTANCADGCPSDAAKIAPGVCGCGVSDADSDGDGAADCAEQCPSDPGKLLPGLCGCGVSDGDGDHDGNADCRDECPGWPDQVDDNHNDIPDGCEEPTPCGPEAIGRGIYRGHAYVGNDADAAALHDVTCITGGLSVFGDAQDLTALASLTEVVGDVWISSNPQLASLAGLEQLTRIGGDLYVEYNAVLGSVDALSALASVGYLTVRDNGALVDLQGLEGLREVDGLVVSSNPSLTDITALMGLTRVGESAEEGMYIYDNATLPPCQAWAVVANVGHRCRPYFEQGTNVQSICANNSGTGSCGDLPGDFVCEPGATGPGVFSGDIEIHPWTADLDGLQLSGLTCVTGSIVIEATSAIDLAVFSSLQLVGGDLSISDSTALTSLDGLDALRSVGGTLKLDHNPALSDVSAPQQLTDIGEPGPWSRGVSIHDNASLSQCQAWDIAGRAGKNCVAEDLNECFNNTGTAPCAPLPDDFACVEGAKGPGVLDGIWLGLYGPDPRHAELFERLRGVRCITQGFYLESAQTLEPLRDLQRVGYDLFLLDSEITDLADLSNLTRVGGLGIIGYHALESLDGLSRLQPPDPAAWFQFMVGDNDVLPACEVWALKAQLGLIGRDFTYGNEFGNRGTGDCGSLPEGFVCEPGARGPGVFDGDLIWSDDDGYGGLTCVTGNLTIEATQLHDLSELSLLEAVGGHLSLHANPQLATSAGLENLTRVGGALSITEQPLLGDLAGFSSLASVGTSVPEGEAVLSIWDNASLPACWVGVIEQQAAQSCGGTRACDGNDGTGSCAP